MAKVPYGTLLPDILPQVLSCPRPSVLRAVQVAASDFFEASQAWTFEVWEPLIPGCVTVEISGLPDETRIVVPLELYIGENKPPLKTANERMLRDEYGAWRSLSAPQPKYVMTADHSPNELVVAPMLNTGGEGVLTGKVAIKPVRLASGMEEAVLDEFADGIVAGALARLLNVRNSEWYAPNEAQLHSRAYAARIQEAKQRGQKANTSRIVTTTYGGY